MNLHSKQKLKMKKLINSLFPFNKNFNAQRPGIGSISKSSLKISKENSRINLANLKAGRNSVDL